jgi:hypothetical protein
VKRRQQQKLALRKRRVTMAPESPAPETPAAADERVLVLLDEGEMTALREYWDRCGTAQVPAR